MSDPIKLDYDSPQRKAKPRVHPMVRVALGGLAIVFTVIDLAFLALPLVGGLTWIKLIPGFVFAPTPVIFWWLTFSGSRKSDRDQKSEDSMDTNAHADLGDE